MQLYDRLGKDGVVSFASAMTRQLDSTWSPVTEVEQVFNKVTSLGSNGNGDVKMGSCLRTNGNMLEFGYVRWTDYPGKERSVVVVREEECFDFFKERPSDPVALHIGGDKAIVPAFIAAQEIIKASKIGAMDILSLNVGLMMPEMLKLSNAGKWSKLLSEDEQGVSVGGQAVRTGSKAGLLAKLDGFENIKSWASTLDDMKDEGLLSRIGSLDKSYLNGLNLDIAHPKYGSEIKALLKESPDDLISVWKKLKDDPAYSWELSKTEPQWQKWSQREFFKDITAKGRGFETDVCLAAFKNRSSAEYNELKNKFRLDFGKNLDEYDMYSQVQLKYDGEDYFVADQLFVKRDVFGEVDDIIIIEDKLSASTPLTVPQSKAFTKKVFRVRSLDKFSEIGTDMKLNPGDVLPFNDGKQWYKVHDGKNGEVITGINKM